MGGRAAIVLVLVSALVPAAACGGGAEGRATVRVLAAASLTDAFGELASAYEAAHPAVEVVLSLAGSSTLRRQIDDGAPADVFAPASPAHVEGLGGEPVVFAGNELVLAVPAGNPGGVTGVDDLARPELLVGVCAPAVPCGALAREVAPGASVDTEEPDVRSLLTKLVEAELDAGLVYRTDVLAAGEDVDAIDVDGPRTDYPIVALTPAGSPFVEFVLGDQARRILAHHGFFVG